MALTMVINCNTGRVIQCPLDILPANVAADSVILSRKRTNLSTARGTIAGILVLYTKKICVDGSTTLYYRCRQAN
jgi:hypothetical protein